MLIKPIALWRSRCRRRCRILRSLFRELKQQRRLQLRKRHLKSEVALPETLSRLIHLVKFVKCWQIFWSWILQDYIKFRKWKGKLLSCDLGLERERHHIASFDVGGDESLASKSSLCGSNVFGESKIKADYWPGQSLVKKCFEGWPRRVPFKTARLHPESWINRLCQQSWHVLICGESESYWERVFWWYFARINCGNIVLGWLWIVLWVPRTWLIVWFSEVSVDRQICGMSWRSCYKNIVYKYKNALWVFSWSNFVLDNQLWGQERWILGMF